MISRVYIMPVIFESTKKKGAPIYGRGLSQKYHRGYFPGGKEALMADDMITRKRSRGGALPRWMVDAPKVIGNAFNQVGERTRQIIDSREFSNARKIGNQLAKEARTNFGRIRKGISGNGLAILDNLSK